MKQEDIDRLKEIFEKEGFQVSTRVMDKSVFEITVKDPWEGVEFIRVNFTNAIFKVVNYDGELFAYFLRDSYVEGRIFTFHKSNFKPSTETEYVEQLKREVFERYGEIKDGDRFESPTGGVFTFKSVNNSQFDYFKEIDQFFIYNVEIYCSGKWAKKLPERVEVEVKNRGWKNGSNGSYDFEFRFNVKNGGTNTSMGDCSIFLSKQLEKYLNNE